MGTPHTSLVCTYIYFKSGTCATTPQICVCCGERSVHGIPAQCCKRNGKECWKIIVLFLAKSPLHTSGVGDRTKARVSSTDSKKKPSFALSFKFANHAILMPTTTTTKMPEIWDRIHATSWQWKNARSATVIPCATLLALASIERVFTQKHSLNNAANSAAITINMCNTRVRSVHMCTCAHVWCICVH